MTRSIPSSKRVLKAIARRAMLERGLLPDFSPGVRSQTAVIARAAAAPGPILRDLRRPALEGKVARGFGGLDIGDRVRVELLRTDVERGFIDFKRSDEVP